MADHNIQKQKRRTKAAFNVSSKASYLLDKDTFT